MQPCWSTLWWRLQALWLELLCAWQVFFRSEAGESAQQRAISGTHMLLWLPHFHDFCLTVRAQFVFVCAVMPKLWASEERLGLL